MMEKDIFISSLSRKRERINYMHQIIRKIKEDKIYNDLQLDVLLRGYIVLIYSMWESAFKDLHLYFYNSLKSKKVKELPYNIKNKILCEKLENAKKSHREIKSYRCIEKLKYEHDQLKETFVENMDKKYFNYLTNNPNIKILKEFLSFYSFSISLEEETINKIQYIIEARNDIAHTGGSINNFQNDIKDKFEYEEEIDFLQDISLEIFSIFNEIINKFEEKVLCIS